MTDLIDKIFVIDTQLNRPARVFTMGLLRNSEQGKLLLKQFIENKQDLIFECGCREHGRAKCHVRRGKRPVMWSYCGEGHSSICANWPRKPLQLHVSSLVQQKRDSALSGLFWTSALPIDGEEATSILISSGNTSSRRRGERLACSTLTAKILAILDRSELNVHQDGVSTRDWVLNADRMQKAIDDVEHDLESARFNFKSPIRVVGGTRPVHMKDLPVYGEGTRHRVHPLMVIGSVVGYEKQGNRVKFKLSGAEHDLGLSAKKWFAAIRRSGSCFTRAALRKLTEHHCAARVLCLVELTRTRGNDITVHQIGLYPTTRECVPVESSYELLMADYLSKHRRSFIKDIYIPEGSRFRHDFRLLDVGIVPLPIEVNGRRDAEYRAAKEEVRRWLEVAHPGHHLIWWAVDDRRLPELQKATTAKVPAGIGCK
jgi:hypothetical protein